MKKEKIFLITCTCLFMGYNVSAQDTLRTQQLKDVVITATRSEKNVSEVGRSISVITSDDIKKSGANSVSELLSLQQGVYIVGTGQNPGMTSSIFMRGANSNQTVILIDGVRITDPSANSNAIDLAELSLANIEKIEIVHGTHSTLYGSSAIGGVVNIITKKPVKEGLSSQARVTAGTFGKNTLDISENLYLSYKFKNGFYVSGEVENRNVDGQDATVDTVTNPLAYKHSDRNDDFDKMDVVGKAGFKNEKLDAYASYKKTDQLADIDKSGYRDDDNYTVDFKRDLFTYGAAYNINQNFKASYIGGYSSMLRTAIDDSSVTDDKGTFDRTFNKGIYKGKTMTNEVQGNYTSTGFNLVLGAGLYDEEMEINTSYLYYNYFGFPPDYAELKTSLDSLDPHSSTSNIFFHSDIGGELISEKLKAFALSGGLRMSNHNLFGNNFSYEINPSLKILDSALLFISYATGYNAPSLYQLYNDTRYFTWDTQYTTGFTRGNKNLKPESSKSFEVGFKQDFKNSSVSVSYFNTKVYNGIEYVYLWDKNIGVDTLGQDFGRDDFRGDVYLNLGTMTTQGVELDLSTRVSEKIMVSANVSLLSGKLRYSPNEIDTAQTGGNHIQIFNNGAFVNEEVETLGLTRRPSTANLSITYFPIPKLSLGVNARHAGLRGDSYYESVLGPYGALGTVAVEEYTLLDVIVRLKVYKGLSSAVKVENVLDKKYYEINGFTTRGRGVYLTLRYDL